MPIRSEICICQIIEPKQGSSKGDINGAAIVMAPKAESTIQLVMDGGVRRWTANVAVNIACLVKSDEFSDDIVVVRIRTRSNPLKYSNSQVEQLNCIAPFEAQMVKNDNALLKEAGSRNKQSNYWREL